MSSFSDSHCITNGSNHLQLRHNSFAFARWRHSVPQTPVFIGRGEFCQHAHSRMAYMQTRALFVHFVDYTMHCTSIPSFALSICVPIMAFANYRVYTMWKHNTYIAPQAATAAAAALYITDRADVQPIGCRLSPHTHGLAALQPNCNTQPWCAV